MMLKVARVPDNNNNIEASCDGSSLSFWGEGQTIGVRDRRRDPTHGGKGVESRHTTDEHAHQYVVRNGVCVPWPRLCDWRRR